MFCKHCEQTKPLDQMYNGTRCFDCIRLYWREQARRRWEMKRFGGKRKKAGDRPPQQYHGVGNLAMAEKDWRIAQISNSWLKKPITPKATVHDLVERLKQKQARAA